MAFALSTAQNINPAAMAAELETLNMEQVLTWCWEKFGAKAAIGTSFQGAGLVIMDHAFRKLKLPFPVFTLDTGILFKETLELKKRLEDFWGIQIEDLHPEQTLAEQEKSFGPELWRRDPDTCCTMRKVLPLQLKLDRLDVWITGMRRQQNEFRKERRLLELYEFDNLREQYLYKLNPMLNWSREGVWDYIRREQIPYNPLHDQGYRSIGCWPCTRAVASGEDDRAGRWEGFEKNECGIHTFLGQSI